MKKLICSVLLAVVASSVLAAPTARKPMTPEERAKFIAARQRQTGGVLRVPGKGFLSIYNAQEGVPDSALVPNIDLLKETAREVDIRLSKKPFSIATAKQVLADEGAGAAVFVIDDSALPMSLIALEENWGFVNLAPLKEGEPSEAKFALRLRKEFIRVTSVVFAGCRSQFKTSPLQTVRNVKELDKTVGDKYGMDAMTMMFNRLPEIGVEPAKMTTYRVACSQGLAPQPTNDIQRAIWEEYHSKPTEPMRIEFDPAKGM